MAGTQVPHFPHRSHVRCLLLSTRYSYCRAFPTFAWSASSSGRSFAARLALPQFHELSSGHQSWTVELVPLARVSEAISCPAWCGTRNHRTLCWWSEPPWSCKGSTGTQDTEVRTCVHGFSPCRSQSSNSQRRPHQVSDQAHPAIIASVVRRTPLVSRFLSDPSKSTRSKREALVHSELRVRIPSNLRSGSA